MSKFSGTIAVQDNATFPFSNFDFSDFENFNSFESAKKRFSADKFFGEKQTFEFAFFTPFSDKNFDEFIEFFEKEFAPKIQKGSFIKLSFFADFRKQFDFAKFDKLSNDYLQRGSVIEFSFFPSSGNFSFDELSFAEFSFPFNFPKNDFAFSFRRVFNR